MPIPPEILLRLKANDSTLTDFTSTYDRFEGQLDPTLLPLKYEDACLIADALSGNTHLTYLNLDGNRLNKRVGNGVMMILKALKDNKTLKVLNLGENTPDILEALELLVTTNIAWVNFGGTRYRFNCIQSITSPQDSYPEGQSIGLGGCGMNLPTLIQVVSFLKENMSITSLDLGGNRFGSEGSIHIAELLKNNKSLKSLGLYNSGLGDTGLATIVNGLEENFTLKSLALGENNITDLGVQTLTQFFLRNQSIETFGLDYNVSIREISTLISTLAKSNIKRLGFRECCLSEHSVLSIIELIKSSRTLEVLDVGRVEAVSGEIASQLIEALESNTVLREMRLHACNLDDAFPHLEKLIANNKSLKKLDFSQDFGKLSIALKEEGIRFIARGLVQNSTLDELNIFPFPTSVENLTALRDALRINTNLIYITPEIPSDDLTKEIQLLLDLNGVVKKYMRIIDELTTRIDSLEDGPELDELYQQVLHQYQSAFDETQSHGPASQYKLDILSTSLAKIYLKVGMKNEALQIAKNIKHYLDSDVWFELASAHLADKKPNYQLVLMLLKNSGKLREHEPLICGTFQSLKFGPNALGLSSPQEQTGRKKIISMAELFTALDLAMRTLDMVIKINGGSDIEKNNLEILELCKKNGTINLKLLDILCRNQYVRNELINMPGVNSDQVVVFEQMILFPDLFPLDPLPPPVEAVVENPEEVLQSLQEGGVDIQIAYRESETELFTLMADPILEILPEPIDSQLSEAKGDSLPGSSSSTRTQASFFAESMSESETDKAQAQPQKVDPDFSAGLGTKKQ